MKLLMFLFTSCSLQSGCYDNVQAGANHIAAATLLSLIQAMLRKNYNFSRSKQEKKPTPFLDWIATGNPVIKTSPTVI